MAAVAPVRPPKEIPAALKEKVDTLHKLSSSTFCEQADPMDHPSEDGRRRLCYNGRSGM